MKKSILLFVCLFSSHLSASDCKFEKQIDQKLDLSSSSELSIRAAAGDLEISGADSVTVASISGRVCASSEAWLDASDVATSGGDTAEITVILPDTDGDWSLTGSRYAYLDLEVVVPRDMPLNVKDSSGDVSIHSVSAVSIEDSSGDMELEDVSGPVSIRDSSGDIELTDINADVTIVADSSGDIRGQDIHGNVLVENDSSGNIRFSNVTGHVVVDKDSSGDISVSDVGGDFKVMHDSGGEISLNRVKGDVDIPDDKS